MARALADFEARVRALLVDAAPGAVWSDNTAIDEGLRHALEEYNRASLERGAVVRPREMIDTVTPEEDTREVSLMELTGLVDVARVWFPYDEAEPSLKPRWTEFEVLWNAGAPSLLLLDRLGDGTEVARVFYRVYHTLEDLDGETETTFNPGDDSVICQGAVGWACFARSVDIAETADVFAVATPNYAAIATRFLKYFHSIIAPRMVAHGKPLRHA